MAQSLKPVSVVTGTRNVWLDLTGKGISVHVSLLPTTKYKPVCKVTGTRNVLLDVNYKPVSIITGTRNVLLDVHYKPQALETYC